MICQKKWLLQKKMKGVEGDERKKTEKVYDRVGEQVSACSIVVEQWLNVLKYMDLIVDVYLLWGCQYDSSSRRKLAGNGVLSFSILQLISEQILSVNVPSHF